MINKGKSFKAFIFVVGFIFLSVATVNADCPADLKWYWTLNEKVAGTYADSLNVKPGTGAANPVPTAGIIQGAQLFDGSAAGIDVNPPGLGIFGTDSFTFAMWVKHEGDLEAGAINTEVAFGREDGATSLQYFVGVRDDSGPDVAAARLQSTTGEGDTTLLGTSDITDGEWHYIVFVRDDSAGVQKNILYVDGVVERELDVVYATGNFGSATAPINIGYLGSGFRFNGAIDEVAVYMRALPQTEIEQNFNAKANLCGATALETLTVGDLNDDGRDDLAGISPTEKVYYSQYLSAWVNIPGDLQSIVTGDFNDDGNDDIAGVNGTLVWYTTDLETWTNIPGTVRSIVAGDLDGDGDDDIAGINPDGAISKIFYTTDLTTWTPIPGLITSIVTGDLDGDGDDDIAGINPDGVISKIFYTTDLTNWTPIPGLITSIVTGDFNNDGKDDIAGINPDGVISKIFYTTDLTNWTPIPGLITSIVTGDLNGDGNDDIAGINPDGVVAKIFYTTDLTNWTTVPGELDQITSGDFNNDGNDDLAGVNRFTGQAWFTLDLATWNYIP